MAGQAISRRALAKVVAAKLADPRVNKRALVRSVAAYVVAHKTTHQLNMLVADVARELAHTHGHVYAKVTSAHPLSAEAGKQITAYLTRHLAARRVELAVAIDSSLIGGLTLEIPDAQLDLSVRHKLKQLSQA